MMKDLKAEMSMVCGTILLLVLVIGGCREKADRDSRDAGQANRVADSGSGIDTGSYESLLVLHDAALNGAFEHVVQLLQAGLNVNAADSAGRTSLMYAAFNGHANIVRILLDSGAETELLDSTGRTALIYGSTGPFPETVELLLERDAMVNVADNDEHFTALMYAAAEGNLDVVKILMEHGADKTMQDIDGDNAESFARQAGHTAVAEYLSKR
jgi:ankyrin repeat protein